MEMQGPFIYWSAQSQRHSLTQQFEKKYLLAGYLYLTNLTATSSSKDLMFNHFISLSQPPIIPPPLKSSLPTGRF